MIRTIQATERFGKQHTPQPCSIQSVFSQAASILGKAVSGRRLTFVNMWFALSNGIGDSSCIDSRAYQNRLEPTHIRSGKRRRLAALLS